MISSEKKTPLPLWAIRIIAVSVFLVCGGIGYFVYSTQVHSDSKFPFRLGLDLAGGTHLVYTADTRDVLPNEVADAMQALRQVIERRVNSKDVAGVAGVLDPVVQVSKSGSLGNEEWRLIVELPGITDVEEAKALIGNTPSLEFKLVDNTYRAAVSAVADGDINAIPEEGYIATGLTGRFLDHSSLQFGQSQEGFTNEPVVVVQFDASGAELFSTITREHVGDILAIFLDGVPIQLPVIREEIPSGTAVISGNYTPEEAREVVRNLNLGALPIPIEPLSTQSIGASLGSETLRQGAVAGLLGLFAVALFMVFWYRLPGLIAFLSLAVYIVAVLALFKVIPVTLTASGIAGFILSIGMAVDANVLIFERMREELLKGKSTTDAVREGFSRAWPSIRDGNVSSLITAVIIFYAGTFLTKGFAVTLTIGILVSMFSAIVITRTLLLALGNVKQKGIVKFLFNQGIRL